MSDKPMALDRRDTMKIIAASALATPAVKVFAQQRGRSLSDPDLLNPKVHWQGVLTSDELAVLAILSGLIIPADDKSPSAMALGAHLFIDEYVSAPYENSKRALDTLRQGLIWLQTTSHGRFGEDFVALDEAQQITICDAIKWLETASADNRQGAEMFALVRDLVSTAFFTTTEGMADIGYVGNKPSVSFDGPPKEVLIKVGLLDGDIS